MKLSSIFQNVRIGPRLIASFCTILALIAVYTLANVGQIRFLDQQTEYLYGHPFLVSQTIREITSDLMHVSLQVEKMSQETDNKEIISKSTKIEDEVSDMVLKVEQLKKIYPGDAEQVEILSKAIHEWKEIRGEIITRLLNGDKEGAQTLTQGQGKVLYRELQKQIALISAEASSQADTFRKEAERVYNEALIITAIYAIILLLLVIIISTLNIRSLLKPLRTLVTGTKEIEKGNYDHQVDVAGSDEFGDFARTFNTMSESIKKRDQELKVKNAENERLLLSILPKSIAERLKRGEEPIADAYSDVSILFADIVSFTDFCHEHPPGQIVELLNELFTLFDIAAKKHGVEKIKTIGDGYMAVSGLPTPCENTADTLIKMAFEMLESVKIFNQQHGTHFKIRIGMNTGPVVAGVIGKDKFIYDLWGDAVNIASRMESQGVEDHIQLSSYTYNNLKQKVDVEKREQVHIKGKGLMTTYLVKG